jgi:hypothetical protein
LGAVKHHELEEPSRRIRTQDEPTNRIVPDLGEHECSVKRVPHLVITDPMPAR